MKVRYSYLPEQFADCEDLWQDLRDFVTTGDFTLGKPLAKFEESFAKLIHILDANYFILWGSRDEELLAKEIKNYAPHVHICPKLSIGKLTSLISKLDLVIGPDTGPTHIAWALNIPSITLFGPTPIERAFQTPINTVLSSNSKINHYKLDKNDFSIKEIKVSDVVKIAKELLGVSL